MDADWFKGNCQFFLTQFGNPYSRVELDEFRVQDQVGVRRLPRRVRLGEVRPRDRHSLDCLVGGRRADALAAAPAVWGQALSR